MAGQDENSGVTRRQVLVVGAASATLGACSRTSPTTLTAPDAAVSADSGAQGSSDSGQMAEPDAGVADQGVTEPEDASVAEDAAAPDAEAQPDAETPDAETPDAAESPDAGTGQIPPEGLHIVDEFGLGIASGDVTPSTAVLWTRYDGQRELQLFVWREGTQAVEQSMVVQPADGGFTHQTISGLQAGTNYRYLFAEAENGQLSGRSRTGRFKTAIPDGSMDSVLIGATACTSNRLRVRTLEKAGARTDLDLFILLGDTTYNDGAETLAEFRDKWESSLERDGYLALREKTSLLATWDDHEVDNNWNPERISGSILSAATRSYFENLPLERLSGTPDRLWRRKRWGRTVDIFVLDCRGERKPSTRRDSSPEYISPAQMMWLKQGLSNSPCRFKLIVNSVPISDLPVTFAAGRNDRWEGYEGQRNEILDHIDNNQIPGVLWLAGDFHLGSVGKVARSGPGSNYMEVLAGPGAQTPNPLAATLRGNQWDYASGTNNYTTLRFDPMTGQVRIEVRDRDDATVFGQTYTL